MRFIRIFTGIHQNRGKWEILAYGIDEKSSRIVNPPWMGFVHKSINTLERELICQYDSIKNGYNRQPGGGVEYRQTLDESYTPLQMRKEIFDAIYACRFQHQHGISVEGVSTSTRGTTST